LLVCFLFSFALFASAYSLLLSVSTSICCFFIFLTLFFVPCCFIFLEIGRKIERRGIEARAETGRGWR
jgi:hypothetical protein